MSSSLPLLPPVAPGELVADKYRVDRVIGRGGMGVVVAATRLEDNAPVAIKILLATHLSDGETVSRFEREGRAVSRIKSSHVARVFDVGELDDKTPFIVMELLNGDDLAHILEERERIDPRTAVDWILQACEAIAEAHANHIVHRDLKPSNLFVVQGEDESGPEEIKVLDFGISKMKLPDAPSVTTTKTSSVMGSPLYMSPEQLKSAKSVDERSDIWSLGVILYEIIAGTPPFNASTMAELGALVLSGEAPWLGDAAPVSPSLASVVATCLRRDPKDRFVSLADFADALAPHGSAAGRASADLIVATLGMPSTRARLSDRALLRAAANSSPDIDPALAKTIAEGRDVVIDRHTTPMATATTTAPSRTKNRFLVASALVTLAVIATFVAWPKRNDAAASGAPPTAPATATPGPTTLENTAAAITKPPAEPVSLLADAGATATPVAPTAKTSPKAKTTTSTQTTAKVDPTAKPAPSPAPVPAPRDSHLGGRDFPPERSRDPNDDIARSSKE